MDAPETREDAQASRLACAVTLGFVLVTGLGTLALASPPAPVALAVAVTVVPAALLAWREMARRAPQRSRCCSRPPAVRLLFVECCGDQLIVDGVRETLGPSGHRVDAPFALCLRRPQTLVVEDRFLQLLRRSTENGCLEVTVNATQARFRSGDGQMVLPLTGTSGWSVPSRR